MALHTGVDCCEAPGGSEMWLDEAAQGVMEKVGTVMEGRTEESMAAIPSSIAEEKKKRKINL